MTEPLYFEIYVSGSDAGTCPDCGADLARYFRGLSPAQRVELDVLLHDAAPTVARGRPALRLVRGGLSDADGGTGESAATATEPREVGAWTGVRAWFGGGGPASGAGVGAWPGGAERRSMRVPVDGAPAPAPGWRVANPYRVRSEVQVDNRAPGRRWSR